MQSNRPNQSTLRQPRHAISDRSTAEDDAYEYELEDADGEETAGYLGTGGPEILPPFGPRLSRRTRIILTVALVVVALLSFFVIADHASSPSTHNATIEKLDEKKSTVMGLVGASSASSTAITLIPGDAGTPIAEKLVDLSSDFLIVIAAIYLEKYLLTIAGFAAFKILIPVSCIMLVVYLWMSDTFYVIRQKVCQIALRLFLLGIAMYALVPVSVFISSMIEATYQESINETITQAEQTSEHIQQGTESAAAEEQPTDFLSTLQNLPETLTNNVSGWVDEAKNALNNFVEALAVMIVTSCVIPLLVLIFFLWLVKSILGVRVDTPMSIIYPRSLRPRRYGRKGVGGGLMRR